MTGINFITSSIEQGIILFIITLIMSSRPKTNTFINLNSNEHMEDHNVKKCTAVKLFYDNHKNSYAFL